MAEYVDWKLIEQEILDKLDIAAEYRAMKVVFATGRPSPKGWLACHAVGRKDGTPSAAVYAGTGPARGRYRDLGGDGLSLNLWEFAALHGGHGRDWKAARKHFAGVAGVELPGGVEPKRPADQIDFQNHPDRDQILGSWASIKGGFDLGAVLDNDGCYGRYPKKSKIEHSQFVVCFPGYNPPGLCDSDPQAWVVASTDGLPIRLHRGPGKEPTLAKTLSVGGSQGSLLGAYALRALSGPCDLLHGGGVVDEGGEVLPDPATPAPPVEVVWKVEGLSDLLALHAALKTAGLLGRHVVLSNSQGALEGVKDEWAHLLKGRTVYIVHDCDRPGQIGSVRWAQRLAGYSTCVKSVLLPFAIEEKHGKDLRDYLLAGNTALDLLALADATPECLPGKPVPGRERASAGQVELFDLSASSGSGPGESTGEGETPPAEAGGVPAAGVGTEIGRDYRSVLDLIGVEVLGEYDDGKIDYYSRFRHKVCEVKDNDRFSYRRLIQHVGEAAREHIHDGKDQVENMRTMEEVRQAIGFFAGLTNLSQVGTLGQGIWPATDRGYVLVNGGQAFFYDKARHVLGRIANPRIDHKTIIDFSATEPWVEYDVMRQLVIDSADPAWCRDVFAQAHAVFLNWNWKHPQDAWTTTLLVACTFAQTLWPWRPEVAITGPSDCGKSSILGVLKSLFGRLEFYTNKPSEAGIRQHVGNRACAIMVDEFENDGKRQAILELFRTTSQGGSLVRGSSDQKGRKFGLKHIPWMAAIESGLSKAADRNRFIILDLKKLAADVRGRLVLPGELALNELGLKLCAVALRHAERTIELFRHLKGQQFDGVHGRVVESFSTPAALKAAVDGLSESDAVDCLGNLLAGRDSIGRQGGGDEADLMKAILDSTFPAGQGLAPLQVSNVVGDAEAYAAHHETLESVGVAMTAGRPGPRTPALAGKRFLFLDMDKVKRYLLRGTPWASLDCEQLLLRLPGSHRQQRKISSARAWGIEVPVRDWVESKHPEEKLGYYLPDEPADTTEDDDLPEEAAPEEAAPEKITPEKVTPEKVTPEGATPEGATPERVTPEGATDVAPEAQAGTDPVARLESLYHRATQYLRDVQS